MTVHESLQHTNWAGAVTSAAIVGQAIDAIVPVYRRCRLILPEVRAQEEAAAREAAVQSEASAELARENGSAAIDGQEQ